MCFFHCPGSNGTTTCYCRETDNVANTRFLGHFCTLTMSHLRTFVANQVLSRIRAFLGVFCPDFYSDIEDFTQILCRYLSKISAAGTSGANRQFCQISWFDKLGTNSHLPVLPAGEHFVVSSAVESPLAGRTGGVAHNCITATVDGVTHFSSRF